MAATLPEIEKYFEAEVQGEFQWHPRYNITPDSTVPVIIKKDGKLIVAPMNFGWPIISKKKNPKPGSKAYTSRPYQCARLETITRAPNSKGRRSIWLNSFLNHRGLLPVGSFYEWVYPQGNDGPGYPVRFYLKNEKFFALGVIISHRKFISGETKPCASIVTMEPNDFISEVGHDRMPLILNKSQQDEWLDENIDEEEKVAKMVVQYPSKELMAYPVAIGKTDNKMCIEPRPDLDLEELKGLKQNTQLTLID